MHTCIALWALAGGLLVFLRVICLGPLFHFCDVVRITEFTRGGDLRFVLLLSLKKACLVGEGLHTM